MGVSFAGRKVRLAASEVFKISQRSGRTPNEESLLRLGDEIASGGKGPRHGRKRNARRRRAVRRVGLVLLAGALLIVGAGGYELWTAYQDFKRTQSSNLCGPNQIYCKAESLHGSFNILAVGSDSRVGLTGALAKQTGAGSVSGQRSDVVKIFHIDTDAHTISVISIPRDTLVQLVANQSTYGQFNRINVNLKADGNPSLLVRTIEANFGIPINHVIVVGFGGLIGAVQALGGVRMDFPYPAHDELSMLSIKHTGCQIVGGVQALAVARSRHFYYNVDHNPVFPRNAVNLTYGQLAAQGWIYDGTSDYGRIDRQNQFLRALINAAKSKWDPLTINAFLSEIPKGITIDAKFGFSELVNLAVKFHSFNPADMHAYTMPTYGVVQNGADVLLVNQPDAQKLLVKVFGQVGTPGGLVEPTNPPPDAAGGTPLPPAVATPTTTTTTTPTSSTTTTVPSGSTVPKTTTTTAPVHTEPYYTFNPTAC